MPADIPGKAMGRDSVPHYLQIKQIASYYSATFYITLQHKTGVRMASYV